MSSIRRESRRVWCSRNGLILEMLIGVLTESWPDEDEEARLNSLMEMMRIPTMNEVADMSCLAPSGRYFTNFATEDGMLVN